MSTVWGSDEYADMGCGGKVSWGYSTSEYQSTLDAIDRMLAAERAGRPFTPPIRTNEPEAGNCGYEPGSLPPTLRWHPIVRLVVRFVCCTAVIYGAMVALPIVGGWFR